MDNAVKTKEKCASSCEIETVDISDDDEPGGQFPVNENLKDIPFLNLDDPSTGKTATRNKEPDVLINQPVQMKVVIVDGKKYLIMKKTVADAVISKSEGQILGRIGSKLLPIKVSNIKKTETHKEQQKKGVVKPTGVDEQQKLVSNTQVVNDKQKKAAVKPKQQKQALKIKVVNNKQKKVVVKPKQQKQVLKIKVVNNKQKMAAVKPIQIDQQQMQASKTQIVDHKLKQAVVKLIKIDQQQIQASKTQVVNNKQEKAAIKPIQIEKQKMQMPTNNKPQVTSQRPKVYFMPFQNIERPTGLKVYRKPDGVESHTIVSGGTQMENVNKGVYTVNRTMGCGPETSQLHIKGNSQIFLDDVENPEEYIKIQPVFHRPLHDFEFLNIPEYVIEDPDVYCRLCAEKKTPLIDIFGHWGDLFKITSKIESLLSSVIQVKKDDNLPQKICEQCINKLNEIQQFVETVASHDKVLREKFEIRDSLEDDTNHSDYGPMEIFDDLTELPIINQQVGRKRPPQLILPPVISIDRSLPFKCDFCDEIMKDRNFKSHYKTHKKTICKYCRSVFHNIVSLNAHRKQFHDFTCDFCNKTFHGRTCHYIMTRHITKAHIKVVKPSEQVSKTAQLDQCKYKCKICKAGSKTALELKLHMKNEHKIFTCLCCDLSFDNIMALDDHCIRSLHETRCQRCDTEFSSLSKFTAHRHVKERGPVECKLCTIQSLNIKFLCKHIFSCHELYACDICQETFLDVESCNKHSLDVHKIKSFWIYKCSECPERYFDTAAAMWGHKLNKHRIEYPGKEYLCSICGKAFAKGSSLRSHERRHTLQNLRDYICYFCNRNLKSKPAMLKHMKQHLAIRDIKCKICSKTFNNVANLKSHIQHKHSNINHPCNMCNEIFKSVNNLKSHKSSVHAFDWLYECGLCSEVTKSVEELQNHFASVHPAFCDNITFNRSSPHQCLICKHYCQNRMALLRHYKDMHSTSVFQIEKYIKENIPSTCEFCFSVFENKAELICHMYNVHQDKQHTVCKTCKCDVCGRKFKNKHNLGIHITNQHGLGHYQCEHCPKIFSTRQRFLLHMQVHSNKYFKQYDCQYCSKRFYNSKAFQLHIRVHFENRPVWNCEYCNRSFTSKSSVLSHTKTHTKKLNLELS